MSHTSLLAIAGFTALLPYASQAQGSPVKAPVPVPAAEAILARAETAVGGRAALDTYKSMRMAGRVDLDSAGLHGTIEVLRAKPDKYLQTMTLNRVGTLIKGYDGVTAWESDASGPALLTDDDADVMRREADWDHDFAIAQALRGARVDSADFEGQTVWELTYAVHLGLETHVFFDRETGFRVGESTMADAGEVVKVQGNYKDFGGVKIPTRVVSRSSAGEMVITIDTVQFNHVDAARLALPAAVKALKGGASGAELTNPEHVPSDVGAPGSPWCIEIRRNEPCKPGR